MPTRRRAALVPWYHQPKPRCYVTTGKGDQCTFSASYVASSAGNQDVDCCKMHGDILAADGWKVRKVRAKVIDIARPSRLRVVS